MNTETKTEQETQAGPAAEEPRALQSEGRLGGQPACLLPVANILETEQGYILEAELPGVSKEGLELGVENGRLRFVGRRTALDRPGRQLFRESRGLDFRREFELDPAIDAARITARLENGLLEVRMPKLESLQPRRIEVS
jgi:HSP20 family protein